LADYLETLSEDEWNRQSLCDGWRNRDVVAHLILICQYSAKNSWKDFIKSGLRVNKFFENTAIELGKCPSGDLLEQFRGIIDLKRIPGNVPAVNVLVDTLVHEQDIRMALGHPKVMNSDSLKLIYTQWRPEEYNIGEKLTGLAGRVKGLQFTITDLEISRGDGATVIGSAHDILLAVVGRKVSIDKLSGVGAEALKSRLL